MLETELYKYFCDTKVLDNASTIGEWENTRDTTKVKCGNFLTNAKI